MFPQSYFPHKLPFIFNDWSCNFLKRTKTEVHSRPEDGFFCWETVSQISQGGTGNEVRDIDKFPFWTINKKPHHPVQPPTVEARAVITLSKIQVAQADSNPLEKWHVIGTWSGVVNLDWQTEGGSKRWGWNFLIDNSPPKPQTDTL